MTTMQGALCSVFWIAVLAMLAQLSRGQSSQDAEKYQEEAVAIYTTVFHKYNARVRPPDFYPMPLPVEVQATLLHMRGLDIQKQELESIIDLEIKWQDARLAWYANMVMTITVELDRVWTPSIFYLNTAKPSMPLFDPKVTINSEGMIMWKRREIVTTVCPTMLDDLFQTCNITLGFTSAESEKAEVFSNETTFSIAPDFAHHKWDIDSAELDLVDAESFDGFREVRFMLNLALVDADYLDEEESGGNTTDVTDANCGDSVWAGNGRGQSSQDAEKDRRKAAIHATVFYRYNARVRPPNFYPKPLPVEVQATLLHMRGLDIQKQELESIIDLEIKWQDARLQWFGFKVMTMTVELDRAWTPSIFYLNTAKPPMPLFDPKVTINSKGTIMWKRREIVTTVCPTMLDDLFPTCNITLGFTSAKSEKAEVFSNGTTFTINPDCAHHKWDIDSAELDLVKAESFDGFREVRFMLNLAHVDADYLGGKNDITTEGRGQSSQDAEKDQEEAVANYTTVFHKYNARVPPPDSSSKPLPVEVQATLLHMRGLDTKKRELESIIDLEIVTINSEGMIMWKRREIVTTICHTMLDDLFQTCNITLGFTSAESEKAEVFSNETTFSIAPNFDHHKWDIDSAELDLVKAESFDGIREVRFMLNLAHEVADYLDGKNDITTEGYDANCGDSVWAGTGLVGKAVICLLVVSVCSVVNAGLMVA